VADALGRAVLEPAVPLGEASRRGVRVGLDGSQATSFVTSDDVDGLDADGHQATSCTSSSLPDASHEVADREGGLLPDDAVSQHAETIDATEVQSVGSPCIASTNSGLSTIPLVDPVGARREAVACSLRFDTPCPRARMAAICSCVFGVAASCACGVAHSLRTAASVSVVPLLRVAVAAYPADPLPAESITVGGGHFARSTCRPSRPFVGTFASPHAPSFQSRVVGVPQAEPPLAFVRRPDLGRAVQTPLSMEPERGKISEDVSQPNANEPWDILKEYDGRAALLDDVTDEGPEPSLVGLRESLAGDADRLAGEARHDEIHCAAPSASIEGGEVAPHRSLIQPAVEHARDQNRDGLGFPLHVTDRSSSGPHVVDGEVEAAVAGAER
jgi:hypothetical protein